LTKSPKNKEKSCISKSYHQTYAQVPWKGLPLNLGMENCSDT
jgi:hypothetical protein